MSFIGYKITKNLSNNLWLCKPFAVLWLVFVFFFVGIALLGGTNSAKIKLLVEFYSSNSRHGKTQTSLALLI